MFCATPLMAVALAAPSIRIEGTGPPVLFHSGMYNTMPHFLYGRFLRDMRRSVSVITTGDALNGPSAIDRIADSVGVDSIGLFAHSGMHPALLESRRIERSVLLDPFALPDLTLLEGVQASNVVATSPTRIMRGGWSVDRVPGALSLRVDGAHEVRHEEAGPLDILDDLYVGLADGLGLRSVRPPNPETRPFSEWSGVAPSTQNRAEYRRSVVNESLDFLLDRSTALTTI